MILRPFVFLVWFSFAFACIPISVSAVPDKLVFVTSEYSPYIVRVNGKATGIIPDLLDAIYDSEQIDILFVPWARAELMLEQGEAFAAFPYGVNERRQQIHWFSDPVISFNLNAFYLKKRFPEGFQWSGFDDFVGYQLVGVRGDLVNQRLINLGIMVHKVGSEEQVMRFLQAERADFTLIDGRVGWHVIDKYIPKHSAAFASVKEKDAPATHYYLMVSRAYPDAEYQLRHFNQRLQAMKASGSYSDLLRLYKQ